MTNQWNQYNFMQRFMTKVLGWTIIAMIIGWPLSQLLGGYGYVIAFFIAWYLTHLGIKRMKATEV